MKIGKLAAAGLAALGLVTASAAPQALTGIGAAQAQAAKRPNIVLILADDLGYNDISLHGNPLVRTPNIDSIAQSGARFENGYTGDAVCSTSRAALMTGRNYSRYGFEWLPNLPGFVNARNGKYVVERYAAKIQPTDGKPIPPERNGLPDTEVTMAQVLKAQGYHTGIVGKWHLGTAPNLLPQRRGFDEFVGFPGGAALYAKVDDPTVVTAKLPWSGIDAYLYDNLTTNVWRDGKPTPAKKYMTYELADEAVNFIDRNKKKPFFLYLAFNSPHNPIQAPKAIYDRMGHIKDEKTRVYYSMIQAMDDGVGQVLRKLKAEGLEKDTIVVFLSDNGGASYHQIPQENLPYRGWKTTYFEGGVHVPFFVKWPARIPAGTMTPGIASSLDLFPTFLAAAGGKLPADREYDGVDLTASLTGQAGPDALRSRSLYWRKGDYRMIRQGDWKLQTLDDPKAVWLFDLATDPTERINLASMMPEKVMELKAAFAAQEKKYIAPAWPATARARINVDGHPPVIPGTVEYVEWLN
ncbi:sulfatase-like hydrolase/transferase [Phenylobacterium sp.]|uniref:sulfatase-like hydrolase/transferase n=1 Tax=Phenylobacterium sp. TaxID=1871053 RepID=UPI0025DAA077|nr:sulfatase-like hydrolase/transferase [Phenylobacterium sp.]